MLKIFILVLIVYKQVSRYIGTWVDADRVVVPLTTNVWRINDTLAI